MTRPAYLRSIERRLFAQRRSVDLSPLWLAVVLACGLIGLLVSSKG